MFRINRVIAITLLSSAVLGTALAEPAVLETGTKSLSFKACGAKYQEAKAAGKLQERSWMEFRRAECGIGGGQGAIAIGPRSEAADREALRRVAFPESLSGEFKEQTPAQQRMRTCLKSYHANKAAGTLGGLRWVQRGGGYYSLCTARLKAQA